MKRNTKTLLLVVLTGALLTPFLFGQFPPQLKHVVVIVQENRTPDNLFHFLSPLCPLPVGGGLNACIPSPVTTGCYDISPCGLSNESGSEMAITLGPLPMSGSTDPDHSHTGFNSMCDPNAALGYACVNDGAWAVKQSVSGETSYSYVENPKVKNYDGSKGTLLGPYLTYAEQYGWGNYMHQTNQGPSYPAHQFLFSGTSALTAALDAASTFISENFSPKTTPYGCLADANATTWQISPLLPGQTPCPTAKLYDANSVEECLLKNTALNNPPGNPVGSFCTDKPNMGALLDAYSISWKYYAPSAGSLWNAPSAIQDICVPKFTSSKDTTLECTGTEWMNKVDFNLKGADVLNDITNCNLAGVSWVIPNGTWSDHAGITGNLGPSWVAAIINAIGQNPTCGSTTTDAGQTFWQNTAIVVTWDDWGGWSDNQPPPILSSLPCTSLNCQGDYQFGFRVPLVVVSAYTPVGLINNDTHNFGSILRMIEGVYGIPEGALGLADARSLTDLHEFFVGSYRSYTFVPALQPANYFLGSAAQKGAPAPPDNDGDDD